MTMAYKLNYAESGRETVNINASAQEELIHAVRIGIA